MSDIHERNLRKALKALYDDLLEAENGSDRNTFGFKHRLKVIHENLEEMMPRLLAIFPHLGEFGSFGDFETEYSRRGDSGIHQLLKSEIKKLAIEIEADLEEDYTTTETITPLRAKTSKKANPYEILKKLESNLRKLISLELAKISKQWWKQRIPGDVKQNAKDRKEKEEKRGIKSKHTLINYVDFTDYAKIIIRSDNWEKSFKHIFRDKNAISVKLRELEPIRNSISHTRNLTNDEIKKLEFYSEDILKGIEYYKKEKKKSKSKIGLGKKVPKLEFNPLSLQMSASSDRTVYPLGSIVYVRANLPQFLHGEKIIFELCNEKRKLLERNEVDPLTFAHPELRDAGIYESSFKMESNDWKVGKTYIARVEHGNAIAEDSFFIDKRMPVVLSDKSVYMINSDMILTVIDPDADKDSQAVEYVGDREDSKIIIESSYGKIDGYKLQETGDSTGIFQGIVGILGIGKGGLVIEREVDGKIINKIQGTGLDDGYIGDRPGQEIKISYKNKTGTATLSVFVSNFGAAIEMDKKMFKSDDKVMITVVAPDFNFDSESIDEIGQKPESIIRIRTGIDEFSNYKLVETGNDTGIFTGELQLTESQEKSSNKSQTKFGPDDGIIACKKEDYIEVLFTMFGNEKVVGRAIINSQ